MCWTPGYVFDNCCILTDTVLDVRLKECSLVELSLEMCRKPDLSQRPSLGEDHVRVEHSGQQCSPSKGWGKIGYGGVVKEGRTPRGTSWEVMAVVSVNMESTCDSTVIEKWMDFQFWWDLPYTVSSRA